MTNDVFERRTRRFEETLDSYRDIPERLVGLGSIDEEQAELWRRMIGFRDVIVHNDADRAIVCDVLQHRLDDLRAVHRALVRAQGRP